MKNLFIAVLSVLILSSCNDDKNTPKPKDNSCTIGAESFPESDTAVLVNPTAFSPNGDGLNDHWSPKYLDIESIEWKIYNESGEEIYQTSDLNGNWTYTSSIISGIEKFKVWVKATSNAGNTIEVCQYIYAYECLPEGTTTDFIGGLIFPDQIDPNLGGEVLLPTDEYITYCP